MQTVITCNNLAEAALVRSLLNAEDIEVLVPDEDTPQPLAGFPGGYRIQVPDSDRVRALAVLHAAGYIKSPQKSAESNSPPPPPRLTLFRTLLLIDAVLAIGVWIQSQRLVSSAPSHVQEYLESLAASFELWDLGYEVYTMGFGINLVGAVLLLFRLRTGLWLYFGGLMAEVLWAWVFPGGIIYGLLSVVGTLEILLAGFIIGFATFDKTILDPGGPSLSEEKVRDSSGR